MAGTYTKLYYHIVFSTKNRQPFITPAVEEELHKYISGVLRGIGGSCIEINGMPDHVHRPCWFSRSLCRNREILLSLRSELQGFGCFGLKTHAAELAEIPRFSLAR